MRKGDRTKLRSDAGARKQAVANLPVSLAEGEGDTCKLEESSVGIILSHQGLRLLRGQDAQPGVLFRAWNGLLDGNVAGLDRFICIQGLHHFEVNAKWLIN